MKLRYLSRVSPWYSQIEKTCTIDPQAPILQREGKGLKKRLANTGQVEQNARAGEQRCQMLVLRGPGVVEVHGDGLEVRVAVQEVLERPFGPLRCELAVYLARGSLE